MVRLDRLVNVLGGYGVRLCCCPVPRSAELRGVVLRDATDDRAEVGDVYLAVGAGSVVEAVRAAVSARAVVVLVRGGEELLADAVAVGEAEGVAVVLADPALSWSQLAGVVYGLVLEGRETESGRGPTDLFALADSLAAATGGAVTIEDQLSRVLAYSGPQQEVDAARLETIMGRQVPAWVRELFDAAGVRAHLVASDEPLFVSGAPERGLTGRMVVAIRVGRELLGAVWVACPVPLEGARRTALTDGARIVALHLLRLRASADLERQVESEWVIRLLEGTADAATVISQLGLPPGPVRVVAVRAHVGVERHTAVLLAFEQATSGFGWSRPGRSALAANSIYTILPGEPVGAARDWLAALRAALPANVTLSAGISAVAAPADLPAGRQEADECLALHEMRAGETAAPAYDESWDEILLQRLRSAARVGRASARGPVADLRKHDGEHGTDYVATLRAWLEAQGDLAAAGERLGVHGNTVRNRLRKMSDVTTLGLDDAAKRIAMTIDLAATVSETDNR
ncbi:PucR family transcriptional regulator [Lentzea albidocapillata]|uniref:DNA-binding transcriptional regulator, PucR family n=1 Tax=Lentzea albidocapillata TaxID=40571 RepID=A0A1W1ZX06_9PSEU|nr:helix-turn-helix domain-containing protein [Lentzea albidocapillata]SMC52985.1 DNA-binding transcriptional regulator, PucR family [Lentzea albidocapillata]